MKITRDNYEAYLLDHLEGNLSEEESALLMVFLEENPDLDADFDIDLEGIQETIPPASLIDTNALLSHDEQVPETVEFWLAKRLEEDKEALSTPIEDENTQKEWERMQKTIVEAPKVTLIHKRDLSIPAHITSLEEWKVAVAEGDIQGHAADAWQKENASDLALFRKTKVQAPEVLYGDISDMKQTGKVVSLFSYAYRAVGVAAAILIVFFIGLTLNKDPLVGDRLLGDTVELNAGRTPFVAQTTSENTDVVKPSNTAQNTSIYHFASETKGTQEQVPTVRKQLPAVTLASLPAREVHTRRVEAFELLPEVQQEMLTVNEGESMAYQETISWQDFVVKQAKKKVLGREQQEDETFLEAVADRLEDRTDGQVAFATNEEDKRFYFRLGKLEITR